jgi:hypothetical protein
VGKKGQYVKNLQPSVQRKIISFALWGENPMYLKGAVANARQAAEYYPGWETWFYVGRSVHPAVQERLSKAGAGIILMNDLRLPPWEGKFWRMLPIADPIVDVCIIRDCDSRFSKREAAAVNEWLDSDKSAHVMRDHRLHTSPIMGGMWGARKGFLPDFKKLLDEWLLGMQSGANRGTRWCKNGKSDQGFLGNAVWPRIQGKVFVHDDRKHFSQEERPFSVQPTAAHLFVGQVWDCNDKPIIKYGA